MKKLILAVAVGHRLRRPRVGRGFPNAYMNR